MTKLFLIVRYKFGYMVPNSILLPKVVNVVLALLEPAGGLTVSALGAQRRFV